MKNLKILFSLFFFSSLLLGQKPEGTIKGKVIDSRGLFPLAGVSVRVKDKNIGAFSDNDGKFEIDKLPAGSYSLILTYIGYEKTTKSDIIVKPDRITFADAEMNQSYVDMQDVVVNSGYFSAVEAKPASNVSYSTEEIRRSPGSAGDVSRILFGLPSLAKLNDQKNSLIVRGGSPMENSFFVDNIEIPNINHYGTQGSSEGPIGVINTDFLKNVNFYSGGFGVNYGDRLSSVMEMTFREGNREELECQLDASFQALGAQIEGPISKGKGSYLISARRSYYDLLFKATDIGGPIPTYYDIHSKFTYDLSGNVKLSILDIASIDKSNQSYEEGIEFEDNYYGYYNSTKNSGGLNLLCIWNKNGYSNFSLSHNYSDIDIGNSEIKTKDVLYTSKSIERDLAFRNLNHFRLSDQFMFQVGFDAKYSAVDYKQHYYPYTDYFGYTTGELAVSKNMYALKAGMFAGLTWNPLKQLSVNPGFRLDYFNYSSNTNFSPRMNISYKISEAADIYITGGVFYQSLPYIILSQSDSFKQLKDPVAYHAIAGLSYLLTEDTRFTLEVYSKEYRNCPVNPDQPEEFVMDQAVENPAFTYNSNLESTGKAYSRGIELIIQKKLAKDFYGMISASYFRARYLDGTNTWRNRIYDNQFTFAAEGGYKPNEQWEFSMRWIYAGGAPYTPFDVKASEAAYKGLIDRSKIYSERLPDYHSLNLRVDKRFHFSKSNIVLYISVWNVYGRENIWGYSWDETRNKIKPNKSWSTLPVFGIEYEF